MKKDHEIFLEHFKKNEQIVIQGMDWETYGYITDVTEKGIYLYQLKNSKPKLHEWNKFIIAKHPGYKVHQCGEVEAKEIFNIKFKSHQEKKKKKIFNNIKYISKNRKANKDIKISSFIRNSKNGVEDFYVDFYMDINIGKKDPMKSIIEKSKLSFNEDCHAHNFKVKDAKFWFNKGYKYEYNAIELIINKKCIEINEYIMRNKTLFTDEKFAAKRDNNHPFIGLRCRFTPEYYNDGCYKYIDIEENLIDEILLHGFDKLIDDRGEIKKINCSVGDPLILEDIYFVDRHIFKSINEEKIFVSPHAEFYL